MATYKVELVLTVNEGHPRKWLADAIYENLQEGEDIEDISIVEMQVVDSDEDVQRLKDEKNGLYPDKWDIAN